VGELPEDGGEVEPHAGQALVVVVVSWLCGYGQVWSIYRMLW
jgi:hypothetical protein